MIRDRIAPSLNATYGKGPMVDSLADHLAGKIEADDYDDRGREYMIMITCWDWFSGGTTAASVAAEIEAILQLPRNCLSQETPPDGCAAEQQPDHDVVCGVCGATVTPTREHPGGFRDVDGRWHDD